MRIRPIIFNTEMVEAILDGRKTVTRRVIKYQPVMYDFDNGKGKIPAFTTGLQRGYIAVGAHIMASDRGAYFKERPFLKGDILYVRETWKFLDCAKNCGYVCDTLNPTRRNGTMGCYFYKAGAPKTTFPPQDDRWKPSIHMPKEAARIWLKVTDVRVERLQDLDSDDAIREGINYEDVVPCVPSLPDNPEYDTDQLIEESQYEQERELLANSFGKLWDSTIKKKDLPVYGWDANPYIWVIVFERCGKPEE